MEYITCGILVIIAVIHNLEYVHGFEECWSDLNYITCDFGYECCDNNTRCCSTGLHFGAIIGIAFGSLFGLFICCACVCLVFKKKHKGHVIGTTVFSNNPHSQSVTIANFGNNGRRGYGGHPQVHQVNAFYGYGVQPRPVPGMVQMAPPAYDQYSQYATAPPQPMFSSSYSSSPVPPVGSSDRSICGPLAPAYNNPANIAYKGNHGSINTPHF